VAAAECALVVVGASLGGVRALRHVLPALPAAFPIPVAIVLHRHPRSGEIVTRQLQEHTALTVTEADDKQPIEAGVFLAPADYHLLVEPGWFSLSLDPPEGYARPSVDVLFESAAATYGPRVVGVVLTGANQDGAEGTRHIRERGGRVIAQDPATADARQMPEAAIAAGADLALPLAGIGAHLFELAAGALR